MERVERCRPGTIARACLALALVGSLAGELHAAVEDVVLERAFPDQPRLKRPIWLEALPGSGGWHVVAEQGGRVLAFRIDAAGAGGELHPFLDLSARTTRRQDEQGLLGLAFHPDFARNRRMFVHYTVRGSGAGRVVELRVPPPDAEGAAPAADPASERVLLEVEQPWGNHNGGQLAFGPDGMLYLGFGDGGAAGDPRGNAQDLATLLGSILRMDVDREEAGRPYAIPPDNPFVDREGARGEIWAFGLRNPWRFSFDPETGALWAGDVGQNAAEEVDVVARGGNYGWKLREGTREYARGAARGPGPLLEPVLDYPRRDGWSVTGGFVYRGKEVPALRGKYVFADYVSGRVWAVAADPERPGEPVQLAEVASPASFGVDARGELYVLSFDGHLYRFAPGG